LLPTLAYGFGFDHGLIEYVGWAALHGKWPYAQSWDTTFPGAILLHVAVLALGGTSALGIRLMDWGIQIANAALVFVLARRLGGPRAGLYASIAYAIAYTAGGFYQTAQRDAFLVPLLLLSVWCVWRFLDDASRRASWLAWAGLAAGLACLIRPTYGLVVAIAAAALVVAGRWGRGVAGAAIFAGAAAMPLVLFVAVYAIAGQMQSLREMAEMLSTVYQYLERVSAPRVIYAMLKATPVLVLVGVALAVASRVWRTRPMEVATLLVLMAGCVIVRLWESKNYPYQFWPLVCLMSIFAGVGWAWAARRWTPRIETGALAAVLLIQLGPAGLDRFARLPAALRPARDDVERYRRLIADSPSQADLALYLREHTSEGDAIQLWGPETVVLYATGRMAATRFLDPFTFLCPKDNAAGFALFSDCEPAWHKPIQIAFRRELVDSLRAHPPRYIAAHYADGSLFIINQPCIAPDLPELRALLDERYVREATFGKWSAFRLRGPGSTAQ
jgi:4-amino-4-deoxy-L-arabinose transferase-like glycosyltransferase